MKLVVKYANIFPRDDIIKSSINAAIANREFLCIFFYFYVCVCSMNFTPKERSLKKGNVIDIPLLIFFFFC